MTRPQAPPTHRRRTPTNPPSSGRRARVVKLVVACIVLACLLVAGVRMIDVHSETRDWRLTVAAAPTRLVYNGNPYLKTRLVTAATEPPGGITSGGVTEGGGRILIPKTEAAGGSSLTSVIVQDGGQKYSYSQMGGG